MAATAPATLGLDAQYRVLREGSGLIDRSGRPWLAVNGSEAAEFLQGQITNDVESLEPGQGCYAMLLDRKGKIRADMRVIRIGPGEFLLDTEPETGDLLRKHLEMYKIGRDAEVGPGLPDQRLLSLIGPSTQKLLGDVPPGPEYSHRELFVAGVACRAITTDGGADLLVPEAGLDAVTEWLLANGAEPVGEDATEIIRVESGRPRVGREIGESSMPAEAGIESRAVSFEKGCYVGQETVARLHYKGKPNRHLRLLIPTDKVSSGDVVLGAEGRELGTVGTAVISPARGPLALAILRREAEPGDEVTVGDGIVAVVESTGD